MTGALMQHARIFGTTANDLINPKGPDYFIKERTPPRGIPIELDEKQRINV